VAWKIKYLHRAEARQSSVCAILAEYVYFTRLLAYPVIPSDDGPKGHASKSKGLLSLATDYWQLVRVVRANPWLLFGFVET